MGLDEYNRKRDFAKTSEPKGALARGGGRSFVIQKHDASSLHYDFRLEHDGVLKSWSVPKGPSLDPSVKRLAMMTEDHPVEYGGFEGVIPAGEYGGGTVLLWDRGTWTPLEDAGKGFGKGAIKFELHGEKLHGRWALVRIRGREKSRAEGRTWLLVKEKDAEARPEAKGIITEEQKNSVATGRDLAEIAKHKDRVWHSNRRDEPALEVPAEVARAKKSPLPGFIEPQLATLVAEAPAGDDWLHEMKFDGYRILARKDKGKVALFTRSGQDWTARFAAVATAVGKLAPERALLDGEIAVVGPDGITSFQALQNAAALPAGQQLVYYVFDLLHLDGRDLRPLPLEARKQALAAITQERGGERSCVRYTDHVIGHGPAFFEQACKAKLEGIISKRKDGVYTSGRTPGWVKTKCVKRQELVIGGWTDPKTAREGIGALLVGFHDGDQLRFAGKVGTGFSQKSARELRARLTKLARKKDPFTPPAKPVPKGVHWVAPELIAEVAFTEITADGKLRHPAFQGLREDKPAADVVREKPQKPTKKMTTTSSPDTVAGVKLTHPERVLWPDVGVTKRDLAAFYESIAAHILPEVQDRPLSLVRCPEGAGKPCFYMKHPMKGTAATLARVDVRESKKTTQYLVAENLAGVIGLVQMSVLEIHPWGSKAATLEAPDRVVFDLDPGPKVKYPAVVAGARAIRARLKSLGAESFVKTTGGKGLHVVLQLAAGVDWHALYEFSRLVSESLVAEHPDQYTTAMPKEGREAKILIDYYRNHRGATAVAAYSTRARPGAPVATPLAWDELDDFSPEQPFTVKTLPARLAELKTDPWAEMAPRAFELGEVIAKLGVDAPAGAKAAPAKAPRARKSRE